MSAPQAQNNRASGLYGKTVLQAANYANSYIYEHEGDYDLDIKTWRIYGNPNLVVSSVYSTSGDDLNEGVYIEYPGTLVYSPENVIALLEEDFSESYSGSQADYEEQDKAYTNGNNTNYVVDFLVKDNVIDDTYNIGFTILVENDRIIGIRDNTF